MQPIAQPRGSSTLHVVLHHGGTGATNNGDAGLAHLVVAAKVVVAAQVHLFAEQATDPLAGKRWRITYIHC